ncbi:MAG: SLC13/DASS family transporter [Firmicutes bacterium]|nr:SLC13/DASS family transporter [Bacillota bacterium]
MTQNCKRYLFVALAALLLLVIYFLPEPGAIVRDGEAIALSREGKASLAVLAFSIVLWVTEAIPFPVTGLIALLLLPLMGPLSFNSAVEMGFGNTIVVFFIAVMIISAALTSSGLTNRLTLMIFSRIGLNSRRVILAFITTGAVLSMWVTNMAVAAMLLPVAVGILKGAGMKPLESNFGKCLLISIAWGCAVGGIATPVGNGANILAMGYLRDLAGVDINFLRWMAVGLPATLMILPLSWLSLVRIFPPEVEVLPISLDKIKGDLRELGALSRKEMATLAIFLLAVALWLFDPFLDAYLGFSLPTEVVALLAACLLFLPGLGVLTWKEAQKTVDWGSIVLIAAGLSIGMSMFETGAARWLAWATLSNIGALSPAVRIFVVVLIVELLKICFSSNTVTGLIIIPIVIALSLELGLNPWLVAGPAAIATSLAFILVTSSPTNVIPYSAGYFTIKDFARAGGAITLVAAVCVTISFLIFG